MKIEIWITLILILIFKSLSANNPNIDDRLKTAENVNYLSPIEKEIVYEINLFRSNPAKYAKDFIVPLAKNYKGKLLYYPNDLPLKTKEGVRALNECVSDLKKAQPLPIVYPSLGLTRAAKDHVKDQSKSGKTGHIGSDNSDSKTRIERYGKWDVRIAENIAYGSKSARQVIISLLIDDGVYDRGHRKNLLQSDFKKVGVAAGSHPVYREMFVMDFAGSFMDK